ncbi:BTAD domain-containing putative transcriptional regulator [Streptomyces johnsoniae]|uniref:BTAD domain-containing putative transcriptional regulator n=1 Tax=Streptomyces johnsoniae TaxID=3075532 RepID=A0ABU2S8T1_9ACTN|nr:BTAD domain-containing putative transcriptional regulator [Streptomyces sp. DSM 41886]MDT0445382.1 BTAD domain-containing putative transcriptional regulator [Streptomyces sp. DSM 41886]
MLFGVLGPLTVRGADGSPVKVPELKVRALLAVLLAGEGQPVSVSRLCDELWGARQPRQPGNSLQTKVSQLRRALDRAEPGSRELVVLGPAGYQLRVLPEAVDAGRFRHLADRARTAKDPRDRAALLSDALGLWRGDAYAGFHGHPAARAAADRLAEQRLDALEDHAEARLELGDHTALAAELREEAERHPQRERLHGLHMRALYLSGRQGEALEVYDRLRRRLAEDLGLDPSPRLSALHRAILTQDPRLVAGPRAEPPTSPGTNLPAPVTALIGRKCSATETRTQIADGARLVTLVGPGGVGKTRLALEIARQLTGGEFPDGVWLVELSALAGPGTESSLAELIAATLGIRETASRGLASRPSGPPDDPLAHALRERRLLLLLDNCEHVVEAAAALAERLLRAAPGLHILATGQEPLGIAGEQLRPVPPLAQADAVELFAARAAAAAPGFVLTDENEATVATVCRRLDGIPLALELAATRVRALGVRELAARLDDRFALLGSGYRGAPPRQQTLRAMIDWSWELLPEDERAVLRRLAVHPDGCGLPAAEAVCAGTDVPAGEVVRLLGRLVDRSLLVATEDPDGPRYRLLESVAAYGLEQLRGAGELAAVHERQRRFCVALAERIAPELYGPGQRQWLERLDRESAGMRAALGDAVRCGAAGDALRLVNALAWYWFLRGRVREARRWLDRALAVTGAAPHAARAEAAVWRAGIAMLITDEAGALEGGAAALARYDRLGASPPEPTRPGLRGRAWAEWFVGFAQWGFGDLTSAEERIASALAAFRAAHDRWGTAAALAAQASVALMRGDLTTLGRNGRESLAVFIELGDAWGRLQATEALGSEAEIVGDYGRAERLHHEALCIAEELDIRPHVSEKLSSLGRIALLRGDYAAADELHERARQLAARYSHTNGEQFAEIGLALSARRRGDFEAAERYLRRWLDWNKRVEAHTPIALTLAELGFIAELRGDAGQALTLHVQGFRAARLTGDPRAVALAAEGLAGAYALGGRPDRAARLLGAAAGCRAGLGAPLPAAERGDVDRIESRARAALGPERYDAAFRAGFSGRAPGPGASR